MIIFSSVGHILPHLTLPSVKPFLFCFLETNTLQVFDPLLVCFCLLMRVLCVCVWRTPAPSRCQTWRWTSAITWTLTSCRRSTGGSEVLFILSPQKHFCNFAAETRSGSQAQLFDEVTVCTFFFFYEMWHSYQFVMIVLTCFPNTVFHFQLPENTEHLFILINKVETKPFFSAVCTRIQMVCQRRWGLSCCPSRTDRPDRGQSRRAAGRTRRRRSGDEE